MIPSIFKLYKGESRLGNNDGFDYAGEMVEMTEEEWINQPLHKKIENILPNILLYCTNKSF